MTARHLTCALAATAALALPTAAQAQTPAQTASVGTCFYQDPSFGWSEVNLLAAGCLMNHGWWVNGSGVRIVKLLSSDAIRLQMTRGLQARVDVDWDAAKASYPPHPAGYWATIQP